jgi:uncharacterized membrane protein YccC
VTAAATFLRRLASDATRIDRTSIEPLYALRSTVGVAIPLVIALALAHPLSGVSAAIGAMCVGFASQQGVYRTRAAVTILTSAGTALGALAGSLTGGDTALNVALTAAWGIACGLIAALGPAANAVGLNSLVTFVIFSQFGFTVPQAAQQAGLVFAGGLLQTVLLVLVWPLQRFSAERGVLERAYRGLGAAAVRIPPHHKLQSPDAQALTLVSDTLADPQPFAKRGETAIFESLLAEAERIRGSLAALTTDRYALESYPGLAAPAALADVAGATNDVLVEIADALHEARAPRDLPEVWHALDIAIDALAVELRALGPQDAGAVPILQRSVGDARGLAGQLRAAWRAGKAPVEPNAGPPSESATMRLFRPGAVVDALATLRANGSIDSPFGRHALRVGVTLALATTAEHVLTLDRAYWIPLTAAIVMRPDFGATFTRGGARVAGTLLGALVASGIALVLHPGAEGYLLLALAAAMVAYLTVAANYAIFTIGITAYVVFLLAFGGLAAHTAVVERLSATLLGGLLALAAYFVWPAWERERVSTQLAKVLERDRDYGGIVLGAYNDPAARDDRAILEAQLAVRLARTNAETSVDRMLAEPVHARTVTVRVALGILAATRRFGLAALTLQSRLPRAAAVNDPQLEALRAALDTSLAQLAQALREHTVPPELPPLRDLQIALKETLTLTAPREASMLVSETDLLVDSVKMIADLLHRLPHPDPAAPARNARKVRPLGASRIKTSKKRST